MKVPAKTLSLFEVGPRDGLQSESKILSLVEKEALITQLMEAGLEDIEVGSFVRADRIPQLKDTDELLKRLKPIRARLKSNARFWAFIPNQKGLELALDAGVDGCSFFVAASNTFCLKNVNRPQNEILADISALLKQAKRAKKVSRVYVSTIVYCPYEGIIAPAQVEKVVKTLMEAGAGEVVLSDTTGHAHPATLDKLLAKLIKKWKPKHFALHLHDTRGTALANVTMGLQYGIHRYDSSVAGMGGCPYAPGAAGNLPSEDLVNFLQGYGGLKKIDLMKLAKAGLLAEKILEKKLPSKVLRSLESKLL